MVMDMFNPSQSRSAKIPKKGKQWCATGRVTSLGEGVGLINGQVYFSTSSSKGKLASVGDRIMFEANYVSKLFQWHATSFKILSSKPTFSPDFESYEEDVIPHGESSNWDMEYDGGSAIPQFETVDHPRARKASVSSRSSSHSHDSSRVSYGSGKTPAHGDSMEWHHSQHQSKKHEKDWKNHRRHHRNEDRIENYMSATEHSDRFIPEKDREIGLTKAVDRESEESLLKRKREQKILEDRSLRVKRRVERTHEEVGEVKGISSRDSVYHQPLVDNQQRVRVEMESELMEKRETGFFEEESRPNLGSQMPSHLSLQNRPEQVFLDIDKTWTDACKQSSSSTTKTIEDLINKYSVSDPFVPCKTTSQYSEGDLSLKESVIQMNQAAIGAAAHSLMHGMADISKCADMLQEMFDDLISSSDCSDSEQKRNLMHDLLNRAKIVTPLQDSLNLLASDFERTALSRIEGIAAQLPKKARCFFEQWARSDKYTFDKTVEQAMIELREEPDNPLRFVKFFEAIENVIDGSQTPPA